MGTRCEIYVRNTDECIGLWRHFDGYPDYMMPMLTEFVRDMYEKWKEQAHWMTYPHSVASLLVAWSYMDKLKYYEELKAEFPASPDTYILFDVLGQKVLVDCEYVYILNIPDTNDTVNMVFEIVAYKCVKGWIGVEKSDYDMLLLFGRLPNKRFKPIDRKVIRFDHW